MMKKWILCLMAVVAIQVLAADFTYKYLVVKGSDGTQTSLSSEGLKLTFDDGQLLAVNDNGNTTFTLTELVSMQFSENESTTGMTVNIKNNMKNGATMR